MLQSIGGARSVSGRRICGDRDRTGGRTRFWQTTLLGSLDVITNRTRVDVLANSELRLCQYLTSRFLTVKGPARIIVSVDGVKVEAGKAVEVSRETCGSVEASAHQGGLVARGVSYKK